MNALPAFLGITLGLLTLGSRSSAQEMERLWDDLAGRDAARAYGAVWALTAAPERAVPFLKERLRADSGDARRIRRLIADLDDRRFAVREAASRDLARLGPAAAPALRDALRDTPSPEVQKRITTLLAGVAEVGPLVRSTEELRAVRAVQALEYIGTAGARDVLRTLAAGAPGARVTDDARASLERLSRLQDRGDAPSPGR
jgi:hypothetical protein